MLRRNFILNAAAATAISTSTRPSVKEKWEPIRFGICADIHHDLIFDGCERLSQFIDAMRAQPANFIIQMGDFCHPVESNRDFVAIWERFEGARYHVIGNHDIERQYSRQTICDFWKSPGAYYSFNRGGYHFVVLDGNEMNPAHLNSKEYDRYISDKQLQWLDADLATTSLPTIVFCHQGLDAAEVGIENAVHVRLVLEAAVRASGRKKVIAVFSGHHHQDYYNSINGIHYVQINSMSYHWQGDAYVDNRFDEAKNHEYPYLKNMALYHEPLWGMVEITRSGVMTLTGRTSRFWWRSPQELGMPKYQFGYEVVPTISSRRMQLA